MCSVSYQKPPIQKPSIRTCTTQHPPLLHNQAIIFHRRPQRRKGEWRGIFITPRNGFRAIYALHFSTVFRAATPTPHPSATTIRLPVALRSSTESHLLSPTRSAGLYSLCWRALASKVFHLPLCTPMSWTLLS